MAIISALPGLKVSVIQNGGVTIEHTDDDNVDAERSTTRYIEAKSDQDFEIRLEVANGTDFIGDALSCHIFVDGKWARGILLFKHEFRAKDYVRLVEGVEIGRGVTKKFRFAGLKTASDGKISKEDAAAAKEIGTIAVKVTQSYVLKRNDTYEGTGAVQATGIVNEKAIKGRGLSHSIGLGNTVLRTPSTYYDTKPAPGTPLPAGTVVFHYRSCEALKSMMIIPRTPSPPPLPSLEEREPSTLTLDEIRELQRRHQGSINDDKAGVKIKREPQDGNPRPHKVARPKAGTTQIEIDQDGSFRESSTSSLPEQEVIELD